MSKKSFFDKFSAQENKQGRSFSFKKSTWKLLDAYKLYGSSMAGIPIKTSDLVENLILDHIQKDKSFTIDKKKWIDKLDSIEKSARNTEIISKESSEELQH